MMGMPPPGHPLVVVEHVPLWHVLPDGQSLVPLHPQTVSRQTDPFAFPVHCASEVQCPLSAWQVSFTQEVPVVQFCDSVNVHSTHWPRLVSQIVLPEGLLAQSESDWQRPVPASGALVPASGVLVPASGVLVPASGVLVPASGVLAGTHRLPVQESSVFTQSDGSLQMHWPPEQSCPLALPLHSAFVVQPGPAPASGITVVQKPDAQESPGAQSRSVVQTAPASTTKSG
jgi:hypothetical protein